MKYPDFSDRNTRTGTIGLVAAGALLLAAPFMAQAATQSDEPEAPEVTEVAAGGATLRNADGSVLQCPQTDGGSDMVKWDCGDTRIQLRTEDSLGDEAELANAVTRLYWLAANGERITPDELDHPASGVYAVHRDGVSIAATERDNLTVYVAASDTYGREIVDRFVAEEAR